MFESFYSTAIYNMEPYKTIKRIENLFAEEWATVSIDSISTMTIPERSLSAQWTVETMEDLETQHGIGIYVDRGL